MENKVIKRSNLNYRISDIQELGLEWDLVSATDNVKSKFYIKEMARKQLAVIKLPPNKIKTGNDLEIILFIGTGNGLTSTDKDRIEREYNSSYNIAVSSVGQSLADPRSKIIAECYQFHESMGEGVKEFADYTELDSNAGDELDTLKKINDMFYQASVVGASDIHLEVRNEYAKIRVRVDGSIDNLYETSLTASSGEAIARVIYTTLSLAASADFNSRTQQDSVASGIFGNKDRRFKLKIRVATNPSINGFDMVMRLINITEDSSFKSLDQLGYTPKIGKQIKDAVGESEGLIIISGTTGSGKTTTLQNIILSVLKENSNRIKVITIEDPPENIINNTTQVPVVRDSSGSGAEGFSKAIKSAMRSDPDIIMIGEIRDEQTALLAVQAVQSGHKTYSTIHTDSAITIIKRLEILGVTRDILATPKFISALVYQKLLPVLCPKCSIDFNKLGVPNKLPLKTFLSDSGVCTFSDYDKHQEKAGDRNIIRYLQDRGIITTEVAEGLIKDYKSINSDKEKENLVKRMTDSFGVLSNHNIRFQGTGCSNCKGGIKGRTVIAEVVRPDFEMLKLIENGSNASITEYWKRNLGGKYAQENAYEKILTGELSPYDVEKLFSPIGRKIV